jgi:hypothetical protein
MANEDSTKWPDPVTVEAGVPPRRWRGYRARRLRDGRGWEPKNYPSIFVTLLMMRNRRNDRTKAGLSRPYRGRGVVRRSRRHDGPRRSESSNPELFYSRRSMGKGQFTPNAARRPAQWIDNATTY